LSSLKALIRKESEENVWPKRKTETFQIFIDVFLQLLLDDIIYGGT